MNIKWYGKKEPEPDIMIEDDYAFSQTTFFCSLENVWRFSEIMQMGEISEAFGLIMTQQFRTMSCLSTPLIQLVLQSFRKRLVQTITNAV